jgi:hypothetical protein
VIHSTYTYAILEVSHAAYQEIKDKLAVATIGGRAFNSFSAFV